MKIIPDKTAHSVEAVLLTNGCWCQITQGTYSEGKPSDGLIQFDETEKPETTTVVRADEVRAVRYRHRNALMSEVDREFESSSV